MIRTPLVLFALAAVVGLSACSRENPDAQQAANTVERKTEQAAATAERKTEQAAATAERKTEQVAASAERQMERAGAAFDDATVTAKVKAALIADDSLKGLSIDVDTSQNVVTLRGTVATDDLKRRAEQVARGLEGVKEVKNELMVKKPA